MRRRSPRASDAWFGVALIVGLMEAWALRRKKCDSTLSHFTRLVFRTDSPAGRLVFCLSWAALSSWFPKHILSETIERHRLDQS